MRLRSSLAACLIFVSGPAAAQLDISPQTARACATVAKAAPPASEVPRPSQTTALNGCDAETLYYGIGREPDPVQARLCAFQQAAAGLDSSSEIGPGYGFSGRAMLMTIYANGVGAKRDLPLATHYACLIGGAPAEIEGRVANLVKKAATHWAEKDFSWCDDITSGLAEGFCAAHERRVAVVGRAAKLATLAARLHGSAASRFVALQQAQATWAQARASGEIDASGTGRAAFYIEEQDLQDRDFLDMLERLAAGHKPPLGPAQLRAATARMQAELHRIATAPPDLTQGWGTVTPASIASTQTTWTRYRDAWGAFAAAAYPGWGPAGAEAWVTMKRADMLVALLKP